MAFRMPQTDFTLIPLETEVAKVAKVAKDPTYTERELYLIRVGKEALAKQEADLTQKCREYLGKREADMTKQCRTFIDAQKEIMTQQCQRYMNGLRQQADDYVKTEIRRQKITLTDQLEMTVGAHDAGQAERLTIVEECHQQELGEMRANHEQQENKIRRRYLAKIKSMAAQIRELQGQLAEVKRAAGANDDEEEDEEDTLDLSYDDDDCDGVIHT